MKVRSLGILEQEVMDIVWSCEICSVQDVSNKLKKNHKLAYTTVATVLQRLYEKNLLVRKLNGKGYKYSPKISKKTFSKKLADSFLRNFIRSFGDLAITSFMESLDNLPSKKRIELLTVLKNHKKKTK